MNYANENDWVQYLQSLERRTPPQCPPQYKDVPCSKCHLRGCCDAQMLKTKAMEGNHG